MSDNVFKKIIIGIMIPLFIATIGWATWMTKQAFSAKQTEFTFQEHKIEDIMNRSTIQRDLDSLEGTIQKSFENLNEKIDKNTQENTRILLDLQKQIGDLDK